MAMTKQQVWKRTFDAAQAIGCSVVHAGALADLKAKEFESEQHFAAVQRAQDEAAAYHALSVRDNAIDRKWAERLTYA
jgi:hypothetical protein